MAQRIIAEYAYGHIIEYKASQIIPYFIWVPNPNPRAGWHPKEIMVQIISLSYDGYRTDKVDSFFEDFAWRSFFGMSDRKTKGSKIKKQLLIQKLAGI